MLCTNAGVEVALTFYYCTTYVFCILCVLHLQAVCNLWSFTKAFAENIGFPKRSTVIDVKLLCKDCVFC